ncbi:hypothetical protein [Streptomyces sp. NPDC056921]|uniref:hypothetical protein n=1 Tax=Streptomyces sp. NPDC056921 TaxID=3345966 RepID=UPI00362A308B
MGLDMLGQSVARDIGSGQPGPVCLRVGGSQLEQVRARNLGQGDGFAGEPAGCTGFAAALFPAHWSGNTGDLVTLREDGSVVLDMDDTFALPEPFDRVAPPMMITTTTGMAVLKTDHPANQTIESGFRSLNIPVPT